MSLQFKIGQTPFTVVGLLMALAMCPIAYADKPGTPTLQNHIDQFDAELQNFSALFYRHYIPHESPSTAKTMKDLAASVKADRNNGRGLHAVATIVHNLDLIKKQPNHPQLLDVVPVLLEFNERKTAEAILALVKEEADKTIVANVSYFFAEYFFQRDKWELTLQYLDGISADLPQERSHHAILMQGTALQRLKQHRPALTLYAKIPSSSQYYTAARVNMAIGNIRQDWWTDAHVIINDLLKTSKIQRQDENIDRLNVLLGYSFLQLQYYRNSRDAFRNVSLNGPYTNRALLGIALTAANQEDYIGALNAITLLKGKEVYDLSVEEAHFLMPFFYEKLQQYTTASTGYSEAIAFYEQRINEINQFMQMDIISLQRQLSVDPKLQLTIDKYRFDISTRAPKSYRSNNQLLESYRPYVIKFSNPKLSEAVQRVETLYRDTLNSMVREFLSERIEHLTSYMNQSRYGIARLYDRKEASN